MRLFLGAVVLALVAGHLLRDTPGYAEMGADGRLHGDLEHYVYWTRLVTLGGVQAAYSGSWPETYAVYPPLTLYGFQAVGTLYRAFQDPAFDPEQAQSSLWLRAAIKAAAMGWHLLAGLEKAHLLREWPSGGLPPPAPRPARWSGHSGRGGQGRNAAR